MLLQKRMWTTSSCGAIVTGQQCKKVRMRTNQSRPSEVSAPTSRAPHPIQPTTQSSSSLCWSFGRLSAAAVVTPFPLALSASGEKQIFVKLSLSGIHVTYFGLGDGMAFFSQISGAWPNRRWISTLTRDRARICELNSIWKFFVGFFYSIWGNLIYNFALARF